MLASDPVDQNPMQLTMANDMILDLIHCNHHSRIIVEQMVMFPRIPFTEGWQLLGNSLEQTDDNTNRGGLHVIAKLVDYGSVLKKSVKMRDPGQKKTYRNTVVTVKQHHLPDRKKNRCKQEYRRPVFEFVFTVDTRIER